MTREEEMMREARKHYDISTFLDGVKWAYEHPNSQTIAEYLYKEKGYPISLNGDIPTYEEVMKDVQTYNNYKMRQTIEKTCDGLESTPNLESLWHDASEEPQEYPILCIDEFSNTWLEYSLNDYVEGWAECVEFHEITQWAYINDLLPKGCEKLLHEKKK